MTRPRCGGAAEPAYHGLVPRETETRRPVAVTSAVRAGLPSPCVDCVFWQHRAGAVSDARRKDRWVRRAEAQWGAWGRVLRTDGRVEGMVQYGDAELFPRARRLPAGPPSRDAALITCVYLGGEDPAGVFERLALECLADLKARGAAAVEAFAARSSGGPPPPGHQTLLDRELLEGLGFTARRERGSIALMRLRLGGLVDDPAGQGLLARLGWLAAPAHPAPLAP